MDDPAHVDRRGHDLQSDWCYPMDAKPSLGVRVISTPNEVRVLVGPCPEQVLEVGRNRQVWQLYSRVGIPSPEDVGVEVAECAERLLAFRRQSPVAHGLRGEQEGNDSYKWN